MPFTRPKSLLIALVWAVSFVSPLAAQDADKVKSDVLSALATPLPITIVGPLLTRDVTVTEIPGGFRAVLEDATLMGLFPIGEVSLVLAPLDQETYRVSDLSFAGDLDFPGLGRLRIAGMALDGIWSSRTRSYSTLNWQVDGLNFQPGEGGQGSISIGGLGFDVIKEPDDANTESRFEIVASDLSVLGMGPQNVTVGRVSALLAANGEEPVDLYSVIRELLMLGTMRDGGAQLQALGRSLLGNSYDTVTMDLSASGLNAVSVFKPEDSYFKAEGVELRAALRDVLPRQWGGADVSLTFKSLDQKEFLPDSVVKVDEATLLLSGGDLPVADMMTAVMLLSDPPRGRPVPAPLLLSGLTGFGKLEISTEGKAIWVEGFKQRMRGETLETVKAFETGFDSWGLNFGLTGLDRGEGRLGFGTRLTGGRFVPGEDAPEDTMTHIRAWFPVELAIESGVTKLNEALLRKLFTDVDIQSLREPVELILPLALLCRGDGAGDRDRRECL